MQSFKKNSLVVMMLFSMGCASSPLYEVKKIIGDRNEIVVSPDRIALECEDVKSDEGLLYGFSIFILDDANTVTAVIQTNTLDKDSCFKRYREIGKIVRNGSSIRVVGIGNLTDSRKLSDSKVEIGGRAFPSNGRILQFLYILNEKKQCYNAYQEPNQPCIED